MKRTGMTMALVMLLLAGVAGAGSLATNVPSGADVYAEWAGRNILFDGSAYGSILLPNGMLDRVVKAFKKNAPSDDSPLGLLQFVLTHRIAFAADVDAEPGPQVYVLVDAGKELAAFQALLKPFSAAPNAASQKASGLPAGAMLTLSLDANQGRPDFYYVARGGIVYFTPNPADLAKALATTPKNSLSANTNFVGAMKHVAAKSPQLRAWVNTAALREMLVSSYSALETFLPVAVELDKKGNPVDPKGDEKKRAAAVAKAKAKVRARFKAFGVDKFDALAIEMAVVDKGMHTKIRLVSHGPHRGLLAGFGGAPLRANQLTTLPGDVDAAFCGNIPIAAVFDSMMAIVREIEPGLANELDPPAAAQKADPKAFHFRRDLLPALGEHVQVVMAPSYGGMLTGTVLKLEIRDLAKLKQQLKRLESHWPCRTIRYRNLTVQCLDMAKLDVDKGAKAFCPAWAIQDKTLYVALWPQVIASAVRAPAVRLADTADFKSLHTRLGKNASGLIYLNTKQIVTTLYPLLLVGGTLQSSLLPEGVGIDNFPAPLHELLAQMSGNMLVYRHDAAGISFESYDRAPVAASVVTLGVATLLPAVTTARSRAREVVSSMNLRMIATACMTVRVDKNRWPASFSEFFAQKVLDNPNILKDPMRPGAEITLIKGKLSRRSDYVLLVWPPSVADGGLPLAFESPKGRSQVNVAFTDGSVQQIPVARLTAILAPLAKKYTVAPDGAPFAISAVPAAKPVAKPTPKQAAPKGK